LSEDVRLALLEKKGLFGRLLQLMLSYERGDWMLCSSYASSLRLNENKIAGAYIEALRWSRVIE
jgi:EAL and modified HD-GYP domain-containing signal transduction protein